MKDACQIVQRKEIGAARRADYDEKRDGEQDASLFEGKDTAQRARAERSSSRRNASSFGCAQHGLEWADIAASVKVHPAPGICGSA